MNPNLFIYGILETSTVDGFVFWPFVVMRIWDGVVQSESYSVNSDNKYYQNT